MTRKSDSLFLLDFNTYFKAYVSVSYIFRYIILSINGHSELLSYIGLPGLLSDHYIVLMSFLTILISVISCLYLPSLLTPNSSRQLRLYKNQFSDLIKSSNTISSKSKFKLPSLLFRILFLALTLSLFTYSYINTLGHFLGISEASYSITLNSRGGQMITEGSGYQTIFLCFASLITSLMATFFRSKPLSLTLSLCFCGFLATSGGYRILFISSTVSLILSWFYIRPQIYYSSTHKQSRSSPRLVLFTLVPAAAIVFSIAGTNKEYFRSFFWSTYEVTDAAKEKGFSLGLAELTGGFHSIDSLMAIIHIFPDLTQNFNYYSGQLRLLIWPIPRQLWLDKPIDTSFVNLLDYGNFQYITLGFLGDAYASLGLAGVIISSLVLGLIFMRLFLRALRSSVFSTSLINFYLYISTLSVFSVFLRDGGVSWGTWIIPVFIYCHLFKFCFPSRSIQLPSAI